jgi:hypothetical protein
MNEIGVRAGLGTQLFQLCIGLAKYGNKLNAIHNWSTHIDRSENKLKHGASDYFISDILTFNFHVDVFLNSIKPHLSPTIDLKSIELVKHNIDAIRKMILIKDIENKNDVVIHNRQWDSALVKNDIYNEMHTQCVNSNIVTDLNNNNAADDFLEIYHAKICIGTYSMFTLSAAVLNPNLTLRLIPFSYWNHEHVYGGIGRLNQCIEITEMFVDTYDNIHICKTLDECMLGD